MLLVNLKLLLLGLCLVATVRANTEIINWHWNQHAPSTSTLDALPLALSSLPLSPPLILNSQQTHKLRLNASSPTHLLIPLQPTHEPTSSFAKWFTTTQRSLNVEMRTIRLCWPASHPTTFTLTLHSSPTSPSTPLLLLTATPSYIPFPSHSLSSPFVPFTLLLEPIHLGFIPESALPLTGAIVGVLLVLWVGGVPGRVWRVVEQVGGSVGAVRRKIV